MNYTNHNCAHHRDRPRFWNGSVHGPHHRDKPSQSQFFPCNSDLDMESRDEVNKGYIWDPHLRNMTHGYLFDPHRRGDRGDMIKGFTNTMDGTESNRCIPPGQGYPFEPSGHMTGHRCTLERDIPHPHGYFEPHSRRDMSRGQRYAWEFPRDMTREQGYTWDPNRRVNHDQSKGYTLESRDKTQGFAFEPHRYETQGYAYEPHGEVTQTQGYAFEPHFHRDLNRGCVSEWSEPYDMNMSQGCPSESHRNTNGSMGFLDPLTDTTPPPGYSFEPDRYVRQEYTLDSLLSDCNRDITRDYFENSLNTIVQAHVSRRTRVLLSPTSPPQPEQFEKRLPLYMRTSAKINETFGSDSGHEPDCDDWDLLSREIGGLFIESNMTTKPPTIAASLIGQTPPTEAVIQTQSSVFKANIMPRVREVLKPVSLVPFAAPVIPDMTRKAITSQYPLLSDPPSKLAPEQVPPATQVMPNGLDGRSYANVLASSPPEASLKARGVHSPSFSEPLHNTTDSETLSSSLPGYVNGMKRGKRRSEERKRKPRRNKYRRPPQSLTVSESDLSPEEHHLSQARLVLASSAISGSLGVGLGPRGVDWQFQCKRKPRNRNRGQRK